MIQDKDAVKSYFQREAARFDAIYDGTNRVPSQSAVDALFRTRLLRQRNEAIAALVDEGANCFEIGCGSGRTAVTVARRRNARVHGIDLAEAMIELARRHAAEAGVAERCRFEAADFDAFAPAERYDTFIAVGVLDYFQDPLPMLRRAATEFVPGGAIVLSYPRERMLLNPARRIWLERSKHCPVYFYGASDVARFAAAIGGRVAAMRTNGPAPLIQDGLVRIELR